jgi:hypothetical protein
MHTTSSKSKHPCFIEISNELSEGVNLQWIPKLNQLLGQGIVVNLLKMFKVSFPEFRCRR